jgi:hypothetical protein
VHAPVDDGPGDLARVFALEEEGGGFGACEAEDLEALVLGGHVGLGGGRRETTYLEVSADEDLTLGRVDSVARERVDFDLLLCVLG